MYLTIALAVIAVIGFIITARSIDYRHEWNIPENEKDKFPKFKHSELYHNAKENVGCALLFGTAVLVVGLLISLLATAILTECNIIKIEPVVSYTTPIYAMEDNVNTSGTFFIGSGSVNDTPVYYYIKEVEGKGLTTDYKNVRCSYINYIEEGEDPYVKEVVCRVPRPWLILLMPIGEYEYYFYIPEGSVTTNYNIDLK